MKLNRTYLILLLLLFIGIQSQAQWDTTWIKTFGGNREDKAFDVIKTNDNGFLVLGSTSSFGFDNSQMYFLKLDSAGSILWSKSHGGSGQESGHSVIQTSDGGYLGVGYTNSTGMGGFDLFLVKLDNLGHLEYEDTFGGLDWDFAWDVQESSPGNYLIVGETQSFGNGGKDGWVIQYNESSQSVDWHKTVGTQSEEYYKALALDSVGNFIATGGGFKPNRTDEDVMVTKFNSDGDTIWTKFYGDTLQDYANDVVWMKNGRITFTGAYSIPGDTITTNLTQIDSNGVILDFYPWWSQSLIQEVGNRIIEIDNGRLAILGTCKKSDGNTDIRFGYTYPNSLFYEEGGTLGGDFQEFGEGIVFLGNQGYLFAGYTDGYASSFNDIIVINADSLGDPENPNNYEKINDTNNVTSILPIFSNQKLKYNSETECFHINNQTKPIFYKIFNTYGTPIATGTLTPQNEICLNNVISTGGVLIIQILTMDKLASDVYKVYKR